MSKHLTMPSVFILLKLICLFLWPCDQSESSIQQHSGVNSVTAFIFLVQHLNIGTSLVYTHTHFTYFLNYRASQLRHSGKGTVPETGHHAQQHEHAVPQHGGVLRRRPQEDLRGWTLHRPEQLQSHVYGKRSSFRFVVDDDDDDDLWSRYTPPPSPLRFLAYFQQSCLA